MAFIRKKNNDSLKISISDKTSSTSFFALKEAYKTIRTNLVLNLDPKPCHIITLTSSLAGEGKSTSSINLAIAIAKFNKKVLMIDGDLRKKKASKYLDFHLAKGLTDIINGNVELDKAISPTKYKNFDFIATGSTVSNPAEILASKEMSNILDTLSERYEYIILDTAPVNVVSDALPLIKKSEGVIIVARENLISKKDFDKLITNLDMIDANILGIIYIGTDSTQPYYHGKSYYAKKYYDRYGKYGKYSGYHSNN